MHTVDATKIQRGPMSESRKLIFELFEFAYFGALLLAYLSLFKLLFETAYFVFFIQPPPGWQ
jgi:hypothetical protein